MASIIEVKNLYKEYYTGVLNHGTLYHDLQSWWARLRGKEDPNSLIAHQNQSEAMQSGELKKRILALNNVSFSVEKGEVLGIVGQNGSGKSTLLKILSRITTPTQGRIRLGGRVSSLLEVGTGFHPELTGRENIYLNGSLLGMQRSEIVKKIDRIINFSEIEKFIDAPTKRYSSGMYVRLAFAIAAHLEAEILIIDEVLAVGDYKFQQKCSEKIQEIIKSRKTVLMVSHNMDLISKLSHRVICLKEGRVVSEGSPSHVVASYLCNSEVPMGEVMFEPTYKKDGIQLGRVAVEDEEGNVISRIDYHQAFYCCISIENDCAIEGLRLGFHVLGEFGQLILQALSIDSEDEEMSKHLGKKGRWTFRSKIPSGLLANGKYYLEFAVWSPKFGYHYHAPRLLSFEIANAPESFGNQCCRPRLEWTSAGLSNKITSNSSQN